MQARIIGLALMGASLIGFSNVAWGQSAEPGRYSIGLTAGTPGVGLEFGMDANEIIGLRVTANFFKISRNVGVNDIDYDGNLKLTTAGVLADLYPFDSGFRASAGAMLNSNKIDIGATPASSVTIGNTTYTPAQVGRLDGKIDFKKFAPYAGIGYSGGRGEPGVAFVADLGVMFQGTPRVDLTATGPITTTPGFATSLAQERSQIQDEADPFKFYPVAKIGVVYRF